MIVVGKASGFPPGCSPLEVTRRVVSFFATAESEPPEALLAFFAEPAAFKWISMSEGNSRRGGRHFVAYEGEGAVAYYLRRRAYRERIKVLMVEVGANSTTNEAGVSLVIQRTATDFKPTWGGRARVADGKATFGCHDGTLRVLSLGMDDWRGRSAVPSVVGWPCPKPRQWKPLVHLVACGRSQ